MTARERIRHRYRQLKTLSLSGLGVFLDGTGIFTHTGATAGYHALFIADAGAERGAVAMANGDDGDDVCVELNRRAAQAFGWQHG